ncbi:pleckstrin homology domain-containing family G member 3 isoform X4 [Clupea harengus]|uniref:Pleckstrin homology domain-containing family G member 3 isoform X4 n=1 Tax=Clupea harengus TaxID=7950 RepID=A0A6P8G8U8_CLUHA|nr:pleckstrin homology domain-containing family G member 3 isoform X4 [Clupea harengus]
MPEGTHCTLHTSQMGEESPRLSTGSSVGSHDPLSSVTAGDCCGLPCSEHSEDERPVSLVSTLSSSSSRDEVLSSSGGGTTPLPLSTPSHPPSEEEEDIDLHLSPPEAPGEPSSSGDACDSRDGDVHVPPAGRTPRKLSLPISPTRSPFATVAMAPNPQLTYLDRVVMEIIETEQMYVRDLCNIVEDYLAHIIDTGTMGPEQVSALFGNIEDIYEFNGELLQSLYMCNGDPVAIARCFVDRSEYFDIYTQYCTNYPNSVAALTECMRSKNLAKFFRDRQASLNLSLPLGSYLLKPVQRILKYHLLLQEIAKHFDPEEEGYEVVEEAIDTMTGVAWYINDMKRKHEHAVRLQEIQSLLINWKGPDLTTYGELVLEGTFHVHRAKNERTLFLFDKILLITKKRVEHFIYKTHISCSTLMLIGSAKDCLRFSVTHFKHRSKQPHTVQAKTLEEKKLWVHHIKRLILENHQAVIPQKAKEAILDIDSICPVKYRYSPERLKKPLSPQGEDFTGSGRQGRRRSEPAKQITKSTKAVLKDGEGCTAIEDQAAPGEGTQTLPEEEATETAMDETLSDQTPAEEGSPQDGSAWTASPVDNQRDIPRIHIEESSPLPPRCERITEAEECFRSMVAGQGDELDTSALIQEENSISSNGTFYEEGEEEEEEEEEAVAMGTGACSSILPSSVLDQASVIAERFASSLSRRNSLVVAADDFTPTSSHPCATSTQLVASSGDPSADAPILRPKADRSTPSLVELDRLYQSRQDSTLSKKDQLLIHKIRHYYEHAEHLDMGFSIKRRESLSFIPAGLVRHLSRQINSTPMDEIAVAAATAAGNRKGSPGVRPTSWSVFNLPGLDKRDEMPKSPAGGTEATRSAAEKRRTVSVSDATLQSEVFHSPSHIIPVWQDMETDMDGVQEDTESNTETKDDETASPTLHHKSFPSRRQRDADCGESLLIQEEDDDVSTVTDASCITPPPTFLSPTKEEARGPESTGSDEHLQRGQALRAPLPRVITLRSGLEEEQQQQILQDVEKVKNKVFQLARQYSQRIKNNRPVLKPRARETESPLTSVQEERTQRTETGTSGLVLSLSSYDQVVIQELKLPSPSPSISSAGSSRVQSPSGPPVSPVPVESFHWPDVRELRSKYAPGRTHGRRTGSGVGVSRSHSTPERMMMMVTESEAERSRSPLSRSSSTSSSCLSLEPRGSPTDYSSMAASDTCLNLGSDAQLLMGTAEEEGGGGSVSRLCGVNSLDTLHLNEQHQQQQQNNKVIAAETVSMPSTGSQGGRGIETTERDERDENVLNGGDGRSALELEAWRSLRRRDWRAYERLQSTTKYSTSSLKTLDGSQRSLVKNLREKFQSLSSYT